MDETYANIEKKLLILYLLDRMGISLTWNTIFNCMYSFGYMDMITTQFCLNELCTTKLIIKTSDDLEETDNEFAENEIDRYSITSMGINALNQFEYKLPISATNNIKRYIKDNRGEIKKKYENTAHYYKENVDDNEMYVVNCGTYEDNTMLMELKIACDLPEQADMICENWRNNTSEIYEIIINELIKNSSKDKK